MRRRIFSLLVLSLLLFAVMALTAYGAKSPVDRRHIDPRIYKAQEVYAFPNEDIQPAPPAGYAEARSEPFKALDTCYGYKMGVTWYDYQRNGSMRRMIDWGKCYQDPDSVLGIHSTWMWLETDQFVDRKDYYFGWYTFNGSSFNFSKGIQPDGDYAGYTTIQVTSDGRAIVTNHNNTETGTDDYQTHAYWQAGCGVQSFVTECRMDPAAGGASQLACEITPSTVDAGHIWPAAQYQRKDENTEYLHVLAQESEPDAGDPQALSYFRTTNPEAGNCVWQTECIDTVYTLAQDLDCTDDGRVLLGWTANRPMLNMGPLQSCDENTCPGYITYVQWDNDLFWEISENYGDDILAGTALRQNLTNHTDSCETDTAESRPYRPFVDLSVLFDEEGDAHITWAARSWPGDANCGGDAGLYRGRIFHYSEDHPEIRTVHNAEWDQTTCSPGAWNLNAGKQTLSQCDGKLYVLFVQINDIPNGIEDDCAHEQNPNFPQGAGNGDLYVTVSADDGLTWDESRDITNTRKQWSLGTPCDSVGGAGGRCPSENWPSMARFGTDETNIVNPQFPAGIVIVPDGGSDPGLYLECQYICDPSAGGIVQDEGYWQESDVMWFRLACVEPVLAPQIDLSPPEIDFPCCVKHGEEKDIEVDVENAGNATLTYSTTTEEDSPNPCAGWLSIANFDGSVPSGSGNIETGIVTVNTGGACNSPGTIKYLSGRVIFNSNAASTPDTLPIECWVADTCIPPIWDTIFTVCDEDTVLGLTVSNTGNFGNQGRIGVTMDYSVWEGDTCTGADVYLYDGSPALGYQKNGGADTLMNFSIFQTTYVDEDGFVPVGDHTPTTDVGEYEIFESGPIVTHDSLVVIEKTWYAPHSHADSCSFVIECIKIYQNKDYKDTTITGVKVGEAIDWDIPSDSGSDNQSGFDAPRKLIYQQGVEYDASGGPGCDNTERFGGIDLLGVYCNGDSLDLVNYPHGAYTQANSKWVYPSGGFVAEELYANMDTLTGYTIYTDPDSPFVDLHMAMCFDTGLVLTGDTTYTFYISIITHRGTLTSFLAEVDRQIEWYKNHVKPPPPTTCCNHDGIRGDVNGDNGGPNVADLTYLVDFLFRGGPVPPCTEEADVNGDAGGPNVADLTYLVDFLFRGGPPPPACP